MLDNEAFSPSFTRNQKKDGTQIYELVSLANTQTDFTEDDILARRRHIMDAFIGYLRENDLTV